MRDSTASRLRRWALVVLASLAVFAGAGSDAHAGDPRSFCERLTLEDVWRDANWSDGIARENGSSRACRQANWSD